MLAAGGVFLATASPLAALGAWLLWEVVYLLAAPGVWRQTEGAQQRLDEDVGRSQELRALRAEIAAALPGDGVASQAVIDRLDALQQCYWPLARKQLESRVILGGLAHALGVAPLDRFGQPLPPRGRERALAAADLETLQGWLQDAYDRRLAELASEVARTSDPASRDLVARQRATTEQLRDEALAIAQAARDGERQLALICDTFHLIHTQLHLQPTEQLLPQIEDAVRSSRALTDAIKEMAPLEERIQRLGGG